MSDAARARSNGRCRRRRGRERGGRGTLAMMKMMVLSCAIGSMFSGIVAAGESSVSASGREKLMSNVYYLNSRADGASSLEMERSFAAFGKLKRVLTVDATRASTLRKTLDTSTCSRKSWPESYYGDRVAQRFSDRYLRALGTSLSHLGAIYTAFDSGAEVALILEDGVTPDLLPTWTKTLGSYVDSLPEDWTLAQLSASGSAETVEKLFFDWQRKRRLSPGWSLPTLPKGSRSLRGTQAYLISRRGMQRLVRAYRTPTEKIDVCSMTCVEFEECLLSDGVKLDENFRVATPPLFVSRKTATTHDSDDSEVDVTEMLYSWAVSLSLTKGKAANFRLDGKLVQDVLDEAMKIPGKLAPNTFKEHFEYHCKLKHGGGSKCEFKKSFLADQKPEVQREATEEEEKAVVGPLSVEKAAAPIHTVEPSLGRVESTESRASRGGAIEKYVFSTPFMAMYTFLVVFVIVFAGTFSRKSSMDDSEHLSFLSFDRQTDEYYS